MLSIDSSALNAKYLKLKQVAPPSPLRWTLEHGAIDGAPFSLEGHEFLRGIFEDWHPDLTVEKASQMGATVWALNARVFYPCTTRPLTVIYYFPTDTDVQDFSKGRVKPMIEGSEYLSRLVSPRYVDSTGLKRIGKGTAYFRGMKSSIATKSVPADILIFDELDEAEPAKESQALKRLLHSKINMVARLSTPSIPDYGINKHFELTDQRFWALKCTRCEKWNITEHDFPENVTYEYNAQDRRVTNAMLVCSKCRKGPLDTQNGEWVARYPHRTEKRGYHLCQLFSSQVRLNTLMEEFLSRKHVQLFWNHNIGVPYQDAKGRITIGEVKACIRDYQMMEVATEASFMGVDVGEPSYVCVAQLKEGKLRYTHIGTVDNLDELDQIIRRLEVRCCVIDGMPYTDSCFKLAKRFPGRVYLCWYDQSKGGIKWDEDMRRVHVDRTETLDGMLDSFRQNEVVLPNVPEIDQFAEHLHALVKKQEEDEETGEVTFTYIRTDEDHYGHAANYLRIAMMRFAGQGGAIAMGAPGRLR
jgi:hypothetical protein